MTDNEIIKALECCLDYSCLICPCEKGASILCIDDLHQYALDLINRQKAEIERLEEAIGQREADIEMFTDIGKMYSELKAEAIKEFAERLKDETFKINYCGSVYNVVDIDDIVNLVKEMVGEKNE